MYKTSKESEPQPGDGIKGVLESQEPGFHLEVKQIFWKFVKKKKSEIGVGC